MTWMMYFDWYVKSLIVGVVTTVVVWSLLVLWILDRRKRAISNEQQRTPR